MELGLRLVFILLSRSLVKIGNDFDKEKLHRDLKKSPRKVKKCARD